MPSDIENDILRRTMEGGKVVLRSGLATRSDLAEILEKVRNSRPLDLHISFDKGAFGFIKHAGELFCWEVSQQLALEEIEFSKVLTIARAADF